MKAGSRFTIAIVASLSLLLASGCASDPLADQFRAGDDKNYIAGDGTVTEFAVENRPSFAPFSGVTESGQMLSSSAFQGKVVVINWWYAACPPCRAEATDLADLSREFAGQAEFVGVNVRDTAETALAFDRTFGIEYPSLMDSQTGEVSLAFTGVVSPQAVPTTLVIDKNGKVASRILGRIDPSILRTLIRSVVDQ